MLVDIKGFKCQIIVKLLLIKHKENGDAELTPISFDSATKTVTYSKYMFDNVFS